jgi:XTP/dITP diphosphohydrolase
MKQHYSLCLASNNEHKRLEISQMLPSYISLLTLKEADWSGILREDHDTFEGNATQKAMTVAEALRINCLSDDSGLSVEALDGAPGVFSARYAGLQATDQQNLDKLIEAMTGVQDRRAKYVAVLCLVWEGKPYLFKGEVTGLLAHEPRGKEGFGYDPLFIPDGFSSTFAEMSPSQKNSLSHRSKALVELVRFLENSFS